MAHRGKVYQTHVYSQVNLNGQKIENNWNLF